MAASLNNVDCEEGRISCSLGISVHLSLGQNIYHFSVGGNTWGTEGISELNVHPGSIVGCLLA